MADHTTQFIQPQFPLYDKPYFPLDLDNYAPWVAVRGLYAPYGICQCGHCGQKTRIAVHNGSKLGYRGGHPLPFCRGHQGRLRPKRAPWVEKYGLLQPYGMCQCGCGESAPIAKGVRKQDGHRKDQPVRFISGHNGRGNRPGDDRFWEQVNKHGPIHPVLKTRCWEWQGDMNAYGYGRYSYDGYRTGVHRVSWELYYGPIPEGMFVCHKCDRPGCMRPEHLFLGDDATNTQDKIKKGRQPLGEQCWNSKLTDLDIPVIRRLWDQGKTLTEISRGYTVTAATIRDVVYRKTWTHV